MYFAEVLKSLREKNHMTQTDLAKHTNLARSTIAGYEKKYRQPSYEILIMLADFFHVSIDYLITGKESAYTVSDPSWAMADI